MLGWALRRNSNGAKDASGPDDTQIDQPDTPAPVFAVRAIKTAIFGTPVARSHDNEEVVADAADPRDPPPNGADAKSPTKPNGILLTPGTATTRRKRVSFGHDVKTGQKVAYGGQQADRSSKASATSPGKDDGGNHPRPKTKLTQALENARKATKAQTAKPDTGNNSNSNHNRPSLEPTPQRQEDDARDAEDAEDDAPEADVTMDLNEPHSRSGKYWKSHFDEYQADAKAEMEKLVKYKQLAKSYAKMKDSEALDLHQKLREEQDKVKRMEAQISEKTRKVASHARDNGGAYDSHLLDDLTKHTAQALEYRDQVEEFELLLKSADDATDPSARRRKQQATSPRTQKTLLEAQRELRRARSQRREMDELHNEVLSLRSELHSAEQRSAKLVDENKRLTQSNSRVSELEKKLEESRAEVRQKDRELRRLRTEHDRLATEHDQLKGNAKSRFSEAEQVLQKKNDKISDLEEEIRTLKADNVGLRRPARADQEAEIGRGAAREAPYPRNRVSAERFPKPADDETKKARASLEIARQGNPVERSGRAVPTTTRHARNGSYPQTYDDETLMTSRAFRERIRTEIQGSGPSVLGDRGNLQETRQQQRSYGTVNRHSYPSGDAAPNALEPTSVEAGTGAEGGVLRKKTSRRYYEQRRQQQQQQQKQKESDARPYSADDEDAQIDLVRDNFAKLGGPRDANASTAWSMNTSRTALPADRQAAAIARLERKRAQRAKTQSSSSERNKENVMEV